MRFAARTLVIAAIAVTIAVTMATAVACGPRSAPEKPRVLLDQFGNPLGGGGASGAGGTMGTSILPPGSSELSGAPKGGKGEIVELLDGSCWYVESVVCPPRTACQPPPNKQVHCPQQR